MKSVFTGPVYVVRDNIDTDQIIPAQYLNLIPTVADEYEKLGSYALCGLPESLYPTRFVKENQLDSDYPIVVGGRNFGCGSSREHAPWALMQYGFRAVISTSFADIFRGNALKNSLLPIVIPAEDHKKLLAAVAANPGATVTVDLTQQKLTLPDGTSVSFPVDAFAKECMLQGVDELGYILKQDGAISAFETKRALTIDTLSAA